MASIQLFSQLQSSLVFRNSGAFTSDPAATDGNSVDIRTKPGRMLFPVGAPTGIVTQDPIALYAAFYKGTGSVTIFMRAADDDAANPITLGTLAAGAFINFNALVVSANTYIYATGGGGSAVLEIVGKMANSQTSI